MDKKQALSGELKEIYERVMNTPVKPLGATPDSTRVTPQTASTPTLTPQPQPKPPPVLPQMEKPSVPPPTALKPPVPPPQPQALYGGSGEKSGVFVFSGKNPPTTVAGSVKTRRNIFKIFLPIFIILPLVVWTIFWLVFFGFV